MNTRTNIVEHNEESLKIWLTQRVARYVRLTPEAIQTNVDLANFGLDSVYAFTLTADIEDYLGLSLEPTIMWDHPHIDALSKVLLELLQQERACL